MLEIAIINHNIMNKISMLKSVSCDYYTNQNRIVCISHKFSQFVITAMKGRGDDDLLIFVLLHVFYKTLVISFLLSVF